MGRYIVLRLVQAIFAIWVVTIIAFGLSHASGDPLKLLVSWDASDGIQRGTPTTLWPGPAAPRSVLDLPE